MQCEAIHPDEFLAAVKPLLERKDMCGLMKLLNRRWNIDQLKSLLQSPQCDVRKVAALSLGLIGGDCCQAILAEKLKDVDPFVNEMAEHALWSIWLRGGSPAANQELSKGGQALESKNIEQAIIHFSNAIQIDPRFAEAYNQRAIAYYCIDRYQQSIEDCEQAVARVGCHFGAWAGMGHCHAHQGNLKDALCCYQMALSINPHLSCISQACEELERHLAEQG